MPEWLDWLAITSVSLGILCALAIVVDLVLRPRQSMWIMNLVWPITALYSGPLGLWLYGRAGRTTTADGQHAGHGDPPARMQAARAKPFWLVAAAATTHCGSGCTLGDICAEWLMYFYPWVLFGRAMFGAWVVDYVFAFAFGIAFQYFTIAPMRNLSVRQGLSAALKADSLSLAAWQIGMYGWMAIAVFVILGRELQPTSPVFWMMMQIAMLAGFATSYPVSWWLLKRGVKEPM